VKTAEHQAIEARFEAYFNAVEEIRCIIWTPKITMPQLRRRVAIVLQKLENKA
jgi:hypothetical protein